MIVRPRGTRGAGRLGALAVAVGALPMAALAIGCAGGAAVRPAVDVARVLEEIDGRGPAFSGELSLPLSPAWTRDFPSEDTWTPGRIELGEPVLVSAGVVAVGTSRWPALFLIDRRSGWLIRAVPTRGPVQAPPVVRGDRLWLADTTGLVRATDLAGNQVWERTFAAPIYASPVLAGELLLVQTTADQVLALDAATGEDRWLYRHSSEGADSELDILGTAAPAVADGQVFVGFGDGTLVRLSLEGGRLEQQASVGTGRFRDVDATPVLSGGLLVTGSFGGPIQALDPGDLSPRWTYQGGLSGPVAVAADMVYFSDTDGTVRALTLADGKEAWSWPPPRPQQDLASGLATGSGGATRTVEEIAPVGPAIDLRWPRPHGQQYTPPVIASGYVIVGAHRGTLDVLDRYTGRHLWQFRPQEWLEGISAAPLVDGRQVIFLSNSGRMYSLVGDALPEDLSGEPSRRISRALGW